MLGGGADVRGWSRSNVTIVDILACVVLRLNGRCSPRTSEVQKPISTLAREISWYTRGLVISNSIHRHADNSVSGGIIGESAIELKLLVLQLAQTSAEDIRMPEAELMECALNHPHPILED
jgi:hypothetical protein